MISIYDSRTVRSSSTAQQILNDLAIYGSDFFDVESSGGGDVEKLWISDRIYITKTTGGTAYLKIVNHADGREDVTLEGASSNPFSNFLIVVTDNCLLLRRADTNNNVEYKNLIAIGKTTDRNDTISQGLFFKHQSSSNSLYMFTDNMSVVVADNRPAYSHVGTSAIATSLIKPYSLTSDEYFTDLMFAWISKPSDEGEVILNDQKYYMFGAVALPYT